MVRYHGYLIDIGTAVPVGILLLIGMARYRIVVFIFFFLLFRSAIFSNPKMVLPRYAVLPLIIYSLYMDMTNGPIWPSYRFNSLPISISVCLLLIWIIPDAIEDLIARSSQRSLFVTCPSCMHYNVHLVTKCKNCAFGVTNGNVYISDTKCKNLPISAVSAKIEVPERVLKMLCLSCDEAVLLYVRRRFYGSATMNDKRSVLKSMVVTSQNLVLLDYPLLFGGWRFKESINISTIERVEAKMKKIKGGQVPILALTTVGGVLYTIPFSHFEDYKLKMISVIHAIRSANPSVNSDIDVPESSWRHGIFR